MVPSTLMSASALHPAGADLAQAQGAAEEAEHFVQGSRPDAVPAGPESGRGPRVGSL